MFSCRKPKKLTQSTVRIGDVSLVQNSTKHPQCASEVSGENSCEISSLKVWNNPPLAPVPFRDFFGLIEYQNRWVVPCPVPSLSETALQIAAEHWQLPAGFTQRDREGFQTCFVLFYFMWLTRATNTQHSPGKLGFTLQKLPMTRNGTVTLSWFSLFLFFCCCHELPQRNAVPELEVSPTPAS